MICTLVCEMRLRRIALSLFALALGLTVVGCGSGGGCDTLCESEFWEREDWPTVAEVQAEIDDGETVNGRLDGDDTGSTPLHMAVSWQDVEIIHLLLDNGAELGAVMGNERLAMTPLHSAFVSTSENDYEVARILLGAGADPNVDSEFLGTPIVLAAGEDNDDPASVQLLLDHGADPELHSGVKGTALMWATANDNIRIARLLVESGADVNGSRADGVTVAFAAMGGVIGNSIGNGDMILLLVEEGADFTIENAQGRSACDVGRVQLRQASRPLEQAIKKACPNL